MNKKTFFFLLLFFLTIDKLFGFCFVSPSCEPVMKSANESALKNAKKYFEETISSLDVTKNNYTAINNTLEKNIKQLKIIQGEEELVFKYLNQLLFEIKKRNKIEYLQNNLQKKEKK